MLGQHTFDTARGLAAVPRQLDWCHSVMTKVVPRQLDWCHSVMTKVMPCQQKEPCRVSPAVQYMLRLGGLGHKYMKSKMKFLAIYWGLNCHFITKNSFSLKFFFEITKIEEITFWLSPKRPLMVHCELYIWPNKLLKWPICLAKVTPIIVLCWTGLNFRVLNSAMSH